MPIKRSGQEAHYELTKLSRGVYVDEASRYLHAPTSFASVFEPVVSVPAERSPEYVVVTVLTVFAAPPLQDAV